MLPATVKLKLPKANVLVYELKFMDNVTPATLKVQLALCNSKKTSSEAVGIAPALYDGNGVALQFPAVFQFKVVPDLKYLDGIIVI
jgi:hypothetical protein